MDGEIAKVLDQTGFREDGWTDGLAKGGFVN
jgi:hypothetical protein